MLAGSYAQSPPRQIAGCDSNCATAGFTGVSDSVS
jgi:hypothetical protein